MPSWFETPLCYLCRGAIATFHGYCHPCARKMGTTDPKAIAVDYLYVQIPLADGYSPLMRVTAEATGR